MLLMGIIQVLMALRYDSNPIYVPYFFCERGNVKSTTATSVLRGLIYMIVMEKPEALLHLQEKYNRAGRQLFEDINAFYALSEIFRDIIRDVQVVLVIDSLDECKEDLPLLLDLIDQTNYTSSKAKWIISSRHGADFASRLKACNGVVDLNLEANWRYVSHAVETYLNEKLPVIAESKEYDSQLYHTVREYLKSRTEDTFLWISAMCKELENAPQRKTFSVLRRLPAELKTMYQYMLKQVHSIDDSEDADFCMRILASMVSSSRPVRLNELGASAGLPSEYVQKTSFLEELVNSCGSFLTVRDDVVYIIHNSAREFLVAELFNHHNKGGALRSLPTRPNAPESSKSKYK